MIEESVANKLKSKSNSKHMNFWEKTIRNRIILTIVIAAIVLYVATCLPVLKIFGSSMEPTLTEGQIIIAMKGLNFDCGDIVVLNYGNKMLVKRVIAGPGQCVDIDEDGNVFVDEMLLYEPYITEKAHGDCSIDFPYHVPEDRYFVMGDNRLLCADSRSNTVGCIADAQVIGKVFFRMWPISVF